MSKPETIEELALLVLAFYDNLLADVNVSLEHFLERLADEVETQRSAKATNEQEDE